MTRIFCPEISLSGNGKIFRMSYINWKNKTSEARQLVISTVPLFLQWDHVPIIKI